MYQVAVPRETYCEVRRRIAGQQRSAQCLSGLRNFVGSLGTVLVLVNGCFGSEDVAR